jgi:hypothetical protein
VSARTADFPALLQAFFTDRLLQQRRASPHTVAAYRNTFRLLLRFAAARLDPLGQRTHFRPRMCPGVHWRMSICLFQRSAKP